ncbi:c-type cytochrome [Mesorhizobium sp.]|uniref:c-type cytochrome n=1 Tax=Mesorhizobium sp. TaxID=1871066 RepID=UPI002580F9E6|nr:c-type cytochrome [Mesorhizobium sp.]
MAVQFGNNSREKNFAQRRVLCLGPSVGICPRLCGGDAALGQRAFQRCSGCHSTADQKKAGPGLGGIVGRPAGSMKGYRYSKALKSSGLVWDEATLDRFLAAPREVVPKTTDDGRVQA